jgi:alpha-tubulin suppressor-like RCC1 family protein
MVLLNNIGRGKLFELRVFIEKAVNAPFEIVAVDSLRDEVLQISTSFEHVVCLTRDPSTSEQKLYGWGSNQYCEIGQVVPQTYDTPTLIAWPRLLTKVGLQVHCGKHFTVVNDCRSVLFAGRAEAPLSPAGKSYGDLREFTLLKSPSRMKLLQVSVSDNHALMLDHQGYVHGLGHNNHFKISRGLPEEALVKEPFLIRG